MFVRLMRDAGFDFEWFDRYCDNLFAAGHEKSREHYDAATSFEMFEHIYCPAQNLGELFQSCDNLISTTDLISENNPPKVNEWWYYCYRSRAACILLYEKVDGASGRAIRETLCFERWVSSVYHAAGE